MDGTRRPRSREGSCCGRENCRAFGRQSCFAWLVTLVDFDDAPDSVPGFAFALTVGFLSGTYSTIYIATPILIDWIGTKPPETPISKAKHVATAR